MIKEDFRQEFIEDAIPQKMSIAERAVKLGKEEELKNLEARAAEFEKRLHSIFSIPTEKIIDDISSQPQVLEELLEIACEARAFADQYRDFNVGGVLLGLRKTELPNDNPWVVMFDANTKPQKKMDKHCSEQYLMDRISAANSDVQRVLAFVVVGEPQTDDDSETTQITLTPCIQCRDRMHKISEETEEGEVSLISPETEVLTADYRHLWKRKFQKVKNLHVFHGERNEYQEL